MRKKRITLYLCFALMFWSAHSFSQSFSPWATSATGGDGTAGTVSISYTVGEMTMVNTASSGEIILTQGFQQPGDKLSSILQTMDPSQGSLALYPSPANQSLWYGVEFAQAGSIHVRLMDAVGQCVRDWSDGAYTSGKQVREMDCRLLAAGNYFLQLEFTPINGSPIAISQQFSVIH